MAQNLYFQQTDAARRAILNEPRYLDTKRLLKHGFKVYSQADEDGIIQEIFKRIGEGRKTFCEIGCGNGLENNSTALLLKNWQGLWVEAETESLKNISAKFSELLRAGQLRLSDQFLTADNVVQIFLAHDVPKKLDFLSVDIDGMDYYLLEALLPHFHPRAIAVEYNAKFAPPIDCVVPYNPRFRWDYSDYFGASLTALTRLLNSQGYELVGCSLSGANAFFVDKSEIQDHFCPPFTPENHYEPARYWLTSGIRAGHSPNFGPFVKRS